MNTVIETASNDDDDDDDGTGAALTEHLRDGAAQQVPASVIEDMVRSLLRRRLPAQGTAGRLVDVVLLGEDEAPPSKRPKCCSPAHGGRREEILSLPDPDDPRSTTMTHRKSAKKFLRASRSTTRSCARRRPPPSHPRLRQEAHRRRLGDAPTARRFSHPQRRGRKGRLEGGYGKYVRLKHNNGYETAPAGVRLCKGRGARQAGAAGQ